MFQAKESDNEYQAAIRMTLSILQQYDQDAHIPVLGFGARLPPFYNVCSMCFALNGNIFAPDEYKTKGILKAYRQNLRKLKMHGPAAHAPCLKHVVDIVASGEPTQDDQFYSILVILTRGVVADIDRTLEQVVRASNYPMSVIIVGLGKNNKAKFRDLEFLDGEEDD
jgi:hypothetical protein